MKAEKQQFGGLFLQEAEDLLGQIEEVILEAEENPENTEAIHRLFRAFHTIKGSGAMFGFDTVAAFTHHVETVLDLVRNGLLPLSSELIDLVLAAKDHIKALLQAAVDQTPVPTEAGAGIIAGLNALLPGARTPQPSAANASATPATQPAKPTPAQYRIRFRPPADIFLSGADPASLLDELRDLGDCTVTAHAGAVPALSQLAPDHCYFSWDITLATDKGLNAIKDVFIFVEDGSELSIEPLTAGEPVCAAASPQSAATAPSPKPEAAAPLPAGPTTETQPVPPPPPAAAPAPPVQPGAAPTAQRKAVSSDATVRVPSERLDRLVNLVGELVMNQSRLSQVATIANVPDLNGPVEELERLVDELRDNVLGIRMMPIGTTFSRFKRLVRDLSAELGKEMDLVTEGAETELDKTVLDQLGDPLVHIIRNSIDHGVELPDARVSLGKPRRGTIRLAAAHLGSNVVITIQDDGRGLDVAAIRAKAVERKLIAPDANLPEREVFNLIFLPGFSTAKQVTNVSGRGVGMDVVRRQIDALRGTVSVASALGQGTTISLTLPLTLAIIDGLLVEIGCDQFIIPMAVVTENVELSRAERSRNNGRNVVAVRGELIPYVRLRESFAINGTEPDVEKIVIARHGEERVGLVVDRVLGSHQTVIQSMGRFYRNIQLISGSTIMGDGRVALILDLAGLVRHVHRTPGVLQPNATVLQA